MAPLKRITQPRFYGMQNIPADGSLLAGNHTLYAFLDLPFMLTEIWKQRELAVRSLGENAHYAIPRISRSRRGVASGGPHGVAVMCRCPA